MMEMKLSDTFTLLGQGFSSALSPEYALFGFIGVMLGTATGVIPGLGPAVAIALLLPMTFGLDPVASFIMFGGIYYGAMYGGAITSILINTPGDSSAVVTTFDGHPMARQGKAGKALAAVAFGSCIGGTFATLMLTLTAPLLVLFALEFGAPDYFALMLLALAFVSAMAGSSALRATFAVSVGLGLSMIGIDLQTGEARGTFGIPQLYNGIDVVLAGIGLFAIGEVLWVASGGDKGGAPPKQSSSKFMLTAVEWSRCSMAWVRGTLIGFFAGVLPGSGGTLATFLAYGVEKRFSPHKEEFGKGAIEGVAAPEAANNAAAGGSMVPLLALGIPGSATTAVMLAAFQLYGLQPGPLLFKDEPDLVWALIASLYVANIMLVVFNLPLIGLWTRILRVPYGLLYSGVLIFASVGAYSLHGSIGDLFIVWAMGLMAFFFRKLSIPLAPVLLAIVLGPLLEQEFRRSMTLSHGDISIFFSRPISAVLLGLVGVSVVVSIVSAVRANSHGRAQAENNKERGVAPSQNTQSASE